MQILWFDDGLGLKSFMVFFMIFSNKFKVFTNIHEYANKISCISDHGIKAHV